jgi:hypothetical protein
MYQMVKQIEPQNVNGKLYYRPADFAHVVGKSENAIYRLTNHGNVFRQLKCTYEYFDKPLIPAEELTAFPFTGMGRYAAKEVYHYTEEGVALPCYICSSEGPGHCPNTKEN